MTSISFTVHRIDGSVQDIEGTPTHLQDFLRLKDAGLNGKELINAVLTDDWGAPPTYVRVSLIKESGERESYEIQYR